VKRTIFFILTFSIISMFISFSLYSQDLGDVNNDGSVDILDALLVVQEYVGLDPLNFDPGAGDVNCDSGIDILDALLIAQYYVGLVAEFECGSTATPGLDVAGQSAAALAIASLIFEETDPGYASTCLSHAEELYSFADNYRGAYPVEGFYPSGSYKDDIAWAAVWLYIKTGDTSCLENAESLAASMPGGKHTLCWDDVSYGVVIKLAQLTGKTEYSEGVEINLDYWMPGGSITYTPGAGVMLWGLVKNTVDDKSPGLSLARAFFNIITIIDAY
jgi:hypothetical protein